MQNTKLLLTSLTLAGLFALAGCSFPGVYKLDIQQGNIVTQDMIDQLKPGMTRRQVRFIMGNALISDPFHPDRLDYIYTLQPGGGQRQQEQATILFNSNDQLIGLAGDFMPGVSRDEAILGQASDTPQSTAKQPNSVQINEAPPAPGSLLEKIQGEVDNVETTPVPSPEPLESTPQ